MCDVNCVYDVVIFIFDDQILQRKYSRIILAKKKKNVNMNILTQMALFEAIT